MLAAQANLSNCHDIRIQATLKLAQLLTLAPAVFSPLWLEATLILSAATLSAATVLPPRLCVPYTTNGLGSKFDGRR